MGPGRFVVLRRAILLVGLVPAAGFVAWFPEAEAPIGARLAMAVPVVAITAAIAMIVFTRLARVVCPRCRAAMRRVTWDRALQRDRATRRPRSAVVRFDCTGCGLTWRDR